MIQHIKKVSSYLKWAQRRILIDPRRDDALPGEDLNLPERLPVSTKVALIMRLKRGPVNQDDLARIIIAQGPEDAPINLERAKSMVSGKLHEIMRENDLNIRLENGSYILKPSGSYWKNYIKGEDKTAEFDVEDLFNKTWGREEAVQEAPKKRGRPSDRIKKFINSPEDFGYDLDESVGEIDDIDESNLVPLDEVTTVKDSDILGEYDTGMYFSDLTDEGARLEDIAEQIADDLGTTPSKVLRVIERYEGEPNMVYEGKKTAETKLTAQVFREIMAAARKAKKANDEVIIMFEDFIDDVSDELEIEPENVLDAIADYFEELEKETGEEDEGVEKKGPGRPPKSKKDKEEEDEDEEKKGPGRPPKDEIDVEDIEDFDMGDEEPKKGPGRPPKSDAEELGFGDENADELQDLKERGIY